MPGDERTSGLFTRSEDIPDERFRFFCAECGEEIHGIPLLKSAVNCCYPQLSLTLAA